MEYAVDVALAAQVKRLALFHHDPLRDDAAVERLADLGRQRVVARGGTLEVFAAAEGQVIELPEVGQRPAQPIAHAAAGVGATGAPRALRKDRPRAWPAPSPVGMLAREAQKAVASPRGVVGRNDPCPCGSGLKYKKCCGKNPG